MSQRLTPKAAQMMARMIVRGIRLAKALWENPSTGDESTVTSFLLDFDSALEEADDNGAGMRRWETAEEIERRMSAARQRPDWVED